jgi:hypothetical protein
MNDDIYVSLQFRFTLFGVFAAPPNIFTILFSQIFTPKTLKISLIGAFSSSNLSISIKRRLGLVVENKQS